MVTNSQIRVLLKSIKDLAPVLNDMEFMTIMVVLKNTVDRLEREAQDGK